MSAGMPEWLKVGAEVGTYSSSIYANTSRSTVARIGKRDVVLDDCQRFNVNRLWRSSGTWGPSTYLVSVDDPAFLRAEASYHRDRKSRAVEKLMREWRDGDDDALEKARRLLGGAS